MSEAEVICEREYVAMRDGERLPLVVRWMKPQPDQNDWRCNYTITLAGEIITQRYAMGVNSTQALVLAMTAVGGQLDSFDFEVFWFDPDDDLGLPGEGEPFGVIKAERAARRASRG